MRYLIYLLLLIAVISPLGVFAYQQQWFASYSESSQWISFQCIQQCFILFWEKGGNDSVTIKWIKGQWQVVVWTLGQNGQLVPLGQQNVVAGQSDYTLIINSSQGTIPSDAQLWIVFVGSISAISAQVSLWSLSFWDKVVQWWRWFWTNEGLMPYSINLRYGIKIMGISVVKIWYIVFIVILLWILFTWAHKKQKSKAIFYYGVCIVLFLWIRNLFNWINWTTTWLENYTFASSVDQKSFFDLWDYITFVDKMREALDLDDQFGWNDCTIMSQWQSRPFVAHLDNVYIKPCNPVTDRSKADYLIYYHQAISQEDLSKPKLLEFNGSFVLKNN